jgi:hypothetical protein
LEMSHADYLMDIVPMRIIWHIRMQRPSNCNKRCQMGFLIGPSRDRWKREEERRREKDRIGTLKKTVECVNAFFTHLAVGLVERPPMLLLIFITTN